MEIDILWDSANEFLKIKDYNYQFTIAKNGKALDILIRVFFKIIPTLLVLII